MTRLGAYVIEGEIGRGNMGRVLRARHSTTGIVRAIKVLTIVGADAELVARFQREAELLARVGGAGVVPVHELGNQGGHLFYVMDLLQGGSLRNLIEKEEKLPWKEAAVLVAKIARSLQLCHEAGIVHRDVKPENILIDDRGEPRLSDFGCARDVAQSLTITGTILGTGPYMPPEQLKGLKVDRRADIYSLGVLVYELVTGTRPYGGRTWVEMCESAERASRASSQDAAGAPPELDEIIGRALAPDAEDRYQTALELAQALEALARGETAAPAARRASLAKRLWIVAAAALAANAGLLVWKLGASPPPPPPMKVTIDSPPEGTIAYYDEALVVSGTVSGPVHELTVHGARVPIVDGKFSATIAALPEAASFQLLVAGTALDGAVVTAERRFERGWRFPVPKWYVGLARALRPKLPLPAGLSFGAAPGEYENARDGSILVFVPGGPCHLGSDTESYFDRKGFDATIEPFFIGKYELTNEHFAAFVAATGHKTLAEVEGTSWNISLDPRRGGEDRYHLESGLEWRKPFPDGKPCEPQKPVVHVSWDDACAYVKWAGLVLPTENQWEKAASWDPERSRQLRFSWGEDMPRRGSPRFANLLDASLYAVAGYAGGDGYDDGVPFLAEVGHFERDCSPCGALDMTGNVMEWCSDEHPRVEPGRIDPMFGGRDFPAARELRVEKGGSWAAPPSWCALSRRAVWPRELVRGTGTGFRVALVPGRSPR